MTLCYGRRTRGHSLLAILCAAALVHIVTSALPTHAQSFHNITVGGLGGPNTNNPIIAFSPPFLHAQPGDQVLFLFSQGNHSITQSTFNKPCEPMDGGFDTGFIPVDDNNTEGPFPAIRIIVADTSPVWMYCRQIGHCALGMVFALNPQNQSMFDTFVNKTAAYQTSVSSSNAPDVVVPALGASGPILTSGSPVLATATLVSSGSTTLITYNSFPGSAAPTSGVSSDHLVTVGGSNELTFAPTHLTAQPGDTITFQFTQGNHSVVQSSFENPCLPLSETSTSGQVGFGSNFIALGDTWTTSVNYTITVNDTEPIFAFCGQQDPFSHCRTGMVFAANTIESGSSNFLAFQRRALQLDSMTPSSSSSSITGPSDVPVGMIPSNAEPVVFLPTWSCLIVLIVFSASSISA